MDHYELQNGGGTAPATPANELKAITKTNPYATITFLPIVFHLSFR